MTTATDVLNASMPSNDADAPTVRAYLVELLATLWREREGFSGKRPFGNSDWTYDLYEALLRAGFVDGALDEDGYIESLDNKTADNLIMRAIVSLG